MSTNMTLIIVSLIFAIAAIIIFIANKKISTNLYLKTNPQFKDLSKSESKKIKSPYSIYREKEQGVLQYSYRIRKNGNYYMNSGIFTTAKDALDSMNELERIEGYSVTTIEGIN